MVVDEFALLLLSQSSNSHGSHPSPRTHSSQQQQQQQSQSPTPPQSFSMNRVLAELTVHPRVWLEDKRLEGSIDKEVSHIVGQPHGWKMVYFILTRRAIYFFDNPQVTLIVAVLSLLSA